MEKLSKLNLSQDFVEQFLSRLPPKSLMRFKCSCTLWCNLIKSPSFVVKHLSNSMGASSMPVLFKRPVIKGKENVIISREEGCDNDDDSVETQISSLDLYNEIDEEYLISTVVEDLNVPLPAPLALKHSSDLIIASHCDGIICLKLFFGNVILWNPAMKEFKLLPKSFLLLPKDDDKFLVYELRYYNEYLGFGYDSKEKDYKVVRFVCYDEAGYWFGAEVYNMDSNSWREIKTPFNELTNHQVFHSSDISIYLNGICYWNVYGRRRDLERFMLSFDMGNELFNEISFPDLPNECGVMITLAIWKESIAFFTYQDGTGVAQSYDMWVKMDDDLGDDKSSWIKHMTIGPLECDGYPLLFCNSFQLFTVNKNGGQIVLYNIGTGLVKYLPIHFTGYMMYNQALNYKNSIVSINGGNVLKDIHISAFYGSGKFQSCYRGEVDISASHDNVKLAAKE